MIGKQLEKYEKTGKTEKQSGLRDSESAAENGTGQQEKVPFSVITFPGSNGLFYFFSPLSRSFANCFFETAVKITGIIEAATVCNFL